MKGGRREEEKPVVEEEKKEEEGFLGGLFGKNDDAPAEEGEGAAPAEEVPQEPAPAPPTEEPAKKKGKKRRHGKYYTPKQLKDACKRLSSKKRQHKNRPFPRERRGTMIMSNPYAFGERPMM